MQSVPMGFPIVSVDDIGVSVGIGVYVGVGTCSGVGGGGQLKKGFLSRYCPGCVCPVVQGKPYKIKSEFGNHPEIFFDKALI